MKMVTVKAEKFVQKLVEIVEDSVVLVVVSFIMPCLESRLCPSCIPWTAIPFCMSKNIRS
jgi:hypothetical protein